MPVHELRAVIRIEAEQAERQGGLDLIESLDYRRPAPPQEGPRFRPRGMDIRHVQRMGKFPVAGVATMRHQVHLRETGKFHVPVVRLEGNIMFEQSARLGAAVDPPFDLELLGPQASVDLTRTTDTD